MEDGELVYYGHDLRTAFRSGDTACSDNPWSPIRTLTIDCHRNPVISPELFSQSAPLSKIVILDYVHLCAHL